MLSNATLLRVDPPPPEPIGPEISVRCALTALTAEQGRVSRDDSLAAVAILYLPRAGVSPPKPAVDGRVLVRPDRVSDPTLYRVARIIEHPGRTLGHYQIYLAVV